MKFLVINGPNLNMMHFTEPGVAGQLDYNGLLDYLELCCTQMGMEVEFFQSNHEGAIIDAIQEEQTLICYGLRGALQGLVEQGCNGPCKDALDKLNKHLNKNAHPHIKED